VDGHRPPHADVTFGPTVPPACPFVAPVRTPTNVPTVAWGRSRGRCRGHRTTSFRVMSGKRRRFGRVRRLPSGRFQVRYSVGEGQPRQAPATFATKDEAERYLAEVEVDLRRGTWFDADAGDIRLDVYAPRWLVERPVELQPRTVRSHHAPPPTHLPDLRCDGAEPDLVGIGAHLARLSAPAGHRAGDGGEGLPAAEGNLEHDGRGRPHPAQNRAG